jgi:hypothetical protein
MGIAKRIQPRPVVIFRIILAVMRQTLSRPWTSRKIEDIPRPFDHTVADYWATCNDARFSRIDVERRIRGPRRTMVAGSGGACRPVRSL